MKIRVLQILAGAKVYNGVSDFLLSYYSHMDRERVHFDFLFCRENTMTTRQNEPFLKDSVFIELKCDITGRIPDSIELVKKVKCAIQRGKYDVVHINTGSISITACCVMAAKLAGTQFIISHSHNSDPQRSRKDNAPKRMLMKNANQMMRRFIRSNSSYLFSCSTEAGEYLFGSCGLKMKKYHQINNAIQIQRFLFNQEIRDKKRAELEVQDNTTVLGCVGRLSPQKNHDFLIDVFSEYHKKNPDSVLWLIGDGELRDSLVEKVNRLGLSDVIMFFGQRKDVNQLLQAMDIFILTSLFEGLGIVSIEAQSAGLVVFLSDEISHEHDISDLVYFISLNETAAVWAEQICRAPLIKENRKNMYDVIQHAGYDIDREAKKLETYYMGLVSNG